MPYVLITAWVVTVAAALGNAARPGFFLAVAICAFFIFLGILYAKRDQ